MSNNILLKTRYKSDTGTDHHTKTLCAFISRLEEQLLNKGYPEDHSLKSVEIGQLLFLLYAHKYHPSNILEEKAVEIASQIYRQSKQQNIQQNIQNYFVKVFIPIILPILMTFILWIRINVP